MSKIKILRILHRASVSGPTHHAAILQKYFNNETFESKLVVGKCLESEKSGKYILDSYGIEYSELPFSRQLNIRNELKSIYNLYKIIKSFKPDIIHSHASKPGLYSRVLGRILNVPVIIHTFHGHVFHSYFGSFKTNVIIQIEKILARRSSMLIAISARQLLEIKSILGADNIELVPLGLDLDKFKFETKNHSTKETISIGFIGRLTAIKNIDYFLAICEEILTFESNYKFYIAGGGELEGTLRKKIREAPLLVDKVIMLGWVSDTKSFYEKLDGLMLTSLNEGTPVSIIEAFANQLPVFSTNVGGVQDVFSNCKSGKLLPLNDPRKAAKIVIEYYKLNGFKRLNESISKNSIYHYGQGRLIRDLERIYIKVIP